MLLSRLSSSTIVKPLLSIMALYFLMLSFSCNKEEPTPAVTFDYSGITAVSGLVKNRAGNPIPGVSISAGGQTTTTDIDGAFLLNQVPFAERLMVTAVKPGYFKGNYGLKPSKGAISVIEMRLIDNAPNFSVNLNSAQNLLLDNGAGIQLPANSVQSASGAIHTGNLNVAIVHLNPSDNDFANVTPGGDLLGTRTNGELRQLYSYGMLMVQMTDDSGNELQLAPGNSSTITFPVPPEMIGNAPPTIPLWHLNETTGIWEEEGTASLQGSNYVGSVSHFSTWNCDLAEQRATFKGRVLDCNNQPVPSIRVKVGQGVIFTDSNGYFETFGPSNTTFSVQVDHSELSIQSPPQTVNPVSAGTTYTIPDFALGCLSYVTGRVICSTNQPVIGYVAVNFGSNSISSYLLGDGSFRLLVPANGQNATLTVVNSLNNVSVSRSITLPSVSGNSIEAGDIEVCDESTNPDCTVQQRFTITGDGYNNQTFFINSDCMAAFAIYSPQNQATVAIGSDDNASISLLFPGNTIGSFSLPDDNINLTVSIGDFQYIGLDVSQITVTEFGGVSQRIKGTFSGSAKRLFFNETTQTLEEFPVTITNGQFEVVRMPDQN
jgi:hypothetical protein